MTESPREVVEGEYQSCLGYLKGRCMFHDAATGSPCNCIECRTIRLLETLRSKLAERDAELAQAIERARLHSSYVREFEELTSVNYHNIQRIEELRKALQLLHDNTAEYISINNLGDPWHNQDMQMARAALRAPEKENGNGH